MTETTMNTEKMVAALGAVLGDKVVQKANAAYTASVGSYWSAQAAAVAPTCVIKPTSAQDVCTIIKTLRDLKDGDHEIKLAIRGGGHTPFAGSASIDNGVTIDMRALNYIEVSEDRSTVSVGAGALWGEVYQECDEVGVMVVGGRGETIGVGGLLTGGGISHFSAQRAFACDNVVNYQLVLADGTLTEANQAQNPDLFIALKGGSNNFGIVTRFDLAAFPEASLWGGNIVYPGGTSSALLDAFAAMDLGTRNADAQASLILSFTSVAGVGDFCSANIEYTVPIVDPPVFQPFTGVEPQLSNTLREASETELVMEFTAVQPAGRRQLYVTTTFYRDGNGSDNEKNGQIVRDVFDLSKHASASLPQIMGVTLSYVVQPVPRYGVGIDGIENVLGLNTSETLGDDRGPLVLCLFALTWDNPAEDEQVEAVAKKLHDDVVALTKSRGLWHPWIYLNYAAKWQKPVDGYGEANKLRLQAASRKHDPEGFFQHQVPGGFKLFT